MNPECLRRALPPILGVLLLGWALAGCATKPKIDWNARIGTYTYDQAVMEMGPPQGHAKLTDGTVVAEWMLRRGQTTALVTYGGVYGYGYGYVVPPPPVIISNTGPSQYLRLTFDPQGVLTVWKKVWR